MPIVIQCPHCARRLRAAESSLNKKVLCPTCSLLFLAQSVLDETDGPAEAAIQLPENASLVEVDATTDQVEPPNDGPAMSKHNEIDADGAARRQRTASDRVNENWNNSLFGVTLILAAAFAVIGGTIVLAYSEKHFGLSSGRFWSINPQPPQSELPFYVHIGTTLVHSGLGIVGLVYLLGTPARAKVTGLASAALAVTVLSMGASLTATSLIRWHNENDACRTLQEQQQKDRKARYVEAWRVYYERLDNDKRIAEAHAKVQRKLFSEQTRLFERKYEEYSRQLSKLKPGDPRPEPPSKPDQPATTRLAPPPEPIMEAAPTETRPLMDYDSSQKVASYGGLANVVALILWIFEVSVRLATLARLSQAVRGREIAFQFQTLYSIFVIFWKLVAISAVPCCCWFILFGWMAWDLPGGTVVEPLRFFANVLNNPAKNTTFQGLLVPFIMASLPFLFFIWYIVALFQLRSAIATYDS